MYFCVETVNSSFTKNVSLTIMKFEQPIPVQELAQRFEAQLIGDDSLQATGINEINKVEPGDVMFVDNEKYFQKALRSAASIILLNKPTDCPPGKALLVVDEPFQAYNELMWQYRPFRPLTQNIHPTAKIDDSVVIEPNVVIGANVTIGKNGYIQANAYIGDDTEIGEEVNVQAGALIATDAFYYKKAADGPQKFRSGGRVIIEDRVEIGAGNTINRGVSGDTVIGAGTKFDSQVHIGHDVTIGKNCLFAAQCAIGGATTIGDNVMLYGQVGVVDKVQIGSNTTVLSKSVVTKSLPGGTTYYGSPAGEVKTVMRQLAALRNLPDFLKGK